MNFLNKELKKFGIINVSIVGAGMMGRSLFAQILDLENFNPSCLCSRRIESVIEVFESLKIKNYKICKSKDEAEKAQKDGFIVGTDKVEIAASLSSVHVLVDCTGNVEAGAQMSLLAIEACKDIVSLNVEMDVIVGHELKRRAEEKGLVYSGSYGDEPGAINEIYDFAKFVGFEVLALGKGKNNPLKVDVTPEDLKAEAESKGLSARMLTSFVDGTNTMIELNAIANATGFLPDKLGCHNIESGIEDLCDKMRLKEEGGILNSYKVVDFVRGIAPGVFAIVRAKNKVIDKEMRYLQMGKGPNYVLYRPYHLTSIETPVSIAKAVVLRQASIEPIADEPIAETVCIAKKDIKKSELIEGIGGRSIYGSLEKYELAKENSYVPIGLINEKTYAKRDIKKGTVLTKDDVILDKDSLVYKLSKRRFD